MAYYAAPVTFVPANSMLSFAVGENPPTNVPTELQPYYKEDIWGARITAACRKANRYHKKGLEWIWLIVGFSSLIAVPIVIYYVAVNNLPDDNKNDDDDDDDHHFFHNDFDKYWKARLISFGVWFALMFLVFIPMKIWKSSGKKAVNQMLANWEQEDRAVRPPGAPFPSLKMKMPGVLSKNIKFTVTFPPTAAPSMYQPGANVPTYIANPPSDPAAQGYYQAPQFPPTSQWGQGPTSGFVGQGPANATPYSLQGGAPPYQAPTNGPRLDNPFGDEKAVNNFEEVKV